MNGKAMPAARAIAALIHADAKQQFEDALTRPSSEADRKFALELHVQLRSRITTQRLPFHSGDETTALSSMHSLFDFVRTRLEHHGVGDDAVGLYALWMLNHRVRDFTAFWHGAATRGRLSFADDANDFRGELLEVQGDLREFADLLGYIALLGEYEPHALGRTHKRPGARKPGASESPPTRKIEPVWPTRNREKELIAARRRHFGTGKGSDHRVGLALSGGGIRSATFSVGVLQALSDVGLYRFVDVLSTVSGGGYTGSLISSWATPPPADQKADGDGENKDHPHRDGPFRRTDRHPEPPAVLHARDRSRYIVEGGAVAVLTGFVPTVSGMLASLSTLYLVACLALLPVFAGNLGWVHLRERLSSDGVLIGDGRLDALVPAGAVLAILLFLGVVRFFWDDRYVVRALIIMGICPVSYGSVAGCVALFEFVGGWLGSTNLSAAALVAAVPAILAALSNLLKRRKLLLTTSRVLLAASPIVAFVGVVACLYASVFDAEARVQLNDVWVTHAGFAVLALIIALATDINRQSPRGYYRDRLARTYLIRRKDDGSVESVEGNRLPFGKPNEYAPIHLLNACANLPSSTGRNLRGRKAFPFVFSSLGWSYPAGAEKGANVKLEHEAEPPGDEDLATAMAISGAAVSPLMADLGPAGATPWLTLFNLRLGYWIRNPNNKKWSPPWAWYIVREFFSWADENAQRLNLSDGGHFENLAIYELLRRRCETIIAVDGEADPELRFGGLMQLQRLAKIDFGADIRIDVGALRLEEKSGLSRSHFALGEIRYANGDTGTLLYIKLSATGDEPGHVQAYRENNPEFPHQSTADQVYDEAQFEAYRALGEHAGRKLLATEVVGPDLAKSARALENIELRRWIHALREETLRSPHFPLPKGLARRPKK